MLQKLRLRLTELKRGIGRVWIPNVLYNCDIEHIKGTGAPGHPWICTMETAHAIEGNIKSAPNHLFFTWYFCYEKLKKY